MDGCTVMTMGGPQMAGRGAGGWCGRREGLQPSFMPPGSNGAPRMRGQKTIPQPKGGGHKEAAGGGQQTPTWGAGWKRVCVAFPLRAEAAGLRGSKRLFVPKRDPVSSEQQVLTQGSMPLLF